MPTMGDSPKAEARLIEINPDEVSGVDMPAIGEPHFVVKGMQPGYDPKNDPGENQGGQMPSPVKKLDASVVPRPVMKAIQTRLGRAIDSVGELQSVAKNLKVADDGEEKRAPTFLVNMAKSVAAEIRSLLPDAEVPVYKRGQASSVLSLHALTKRVEDVEKANAVSYLMRDQYVSVTQSVSEYLSTYVEGVETDDDGPMLIPVALEETVDKTAGSLEELTSEYPADDTSSASEGTPVSEESTQKGTTIQKSGLDFAREFAKLNKSITGLSKEVTKVVASSQQETETMSKEIKKTEEEVVEDDQETTEDETEETEVEETEETEDEEETEEEETEDDEETEEDEESEEMVEKSDILKALGVMGKKFAKRFDKLEKSVEDIRGVAQAADEKVEKATLRRADSKGGGNDSTTKVTEKGKKDPSSFKNILGFTS